MLAGFTAPWLLWTGSQVLLAADGESAQLDTRHQFRLPLSQPFSTQINAAASRLLDRTRIFRRVKSAHYAVRNFDGDG